MTPKHIHVRRSDASLLPAQGNVRTTIFATPLPLGTSAVYTDLSKAWHDTEVRPDPGFPLILTVNAYGEYELFDEDDVYEGYFDDAPHRWDEFVGDAHICRWAYVSDLVPTEGRKGGAE